MYDHLSVDGLGIADEIPGPVFRVIGMPKLTTRMVARFHWSRIRGSSLPQDSGYRQIGNAFPPPVASAIGRTRG